PRPIGRPTGSVTALAPPPGKASTVAAPIAPAAVRPPEPPPGRAGSTHLAGMTDDDLGVPPRRSLALPLLLGAVGLLLVGGGLAFQSRTRHALAPRDAGQPGLPRDAGDVDVSAVLDGPVSDAAVAVDAPVVPVDAPPVPIDAGRRRPVRLLRDAGHPVR